MQHGKLTVVDVMTEPVVTINSRARVADVLALAASKRINHFPIVEQDSLIGLVCTCDLRDARPEASIWLMARHPPVTVPASCSAVRAGRLMNAYAVGSVVVLDRHRICGIVTREDLTRASPALEALMDQSLCWACRARRHLRACPDGTYLCTDCHERSSDMFWRTPVLAAAT